MGPYIPSFSVNDLSTLRIAKEARPIEVENSKENLAMSAEALGETRFEDE